MKDWITRISARLRQVTQNMRARLTRFSKYATHVITGLSKWVALHRVWFWAFLAIVVYLLLSVYFLDLIASHYERRPEIPKELRIDNLAFWTGNPEGAQKLILAIGGWFGLLAAIVGFVLAGFRTSTQMQMTQTAIDGQVTERFTRAVEQLGHEKRAVRLGAIYALERIAKDSARDRDTIVETLAAYIRENAPWPPRDKESGQPFAGDTLEAEKKRLGVRPPIDIAAALTVLCGLLLLPDGDAMRSNVDLRHTDLRGLDAPGINLSRMRLDQANLSQATLSGAVLTQTKMPKTNLSSALMNMAKLHGATLDEADLSGANLYWGILRGASLLEVNLSHAYLVDADLNNASLSKADLRSADLYASNVSNTDLSGTQNLTQEQIDSIQYRRGHPPRNLPAGLTLPEPNGP